MLKVNNLTVTYGAINAVKGISFTLEKGEIVCIIGNNGAGKSSTLKALTGVVAPKSGDIELFGKNITGLASHLITACGIAMVPEGREIFTQMTVIENLEMGAFIRKDKDGIKKDMNKVFELFPVLSERKKQKSGTLSGGEQQMLAIGRALMEKPKILLLDEPSLGLAPILVESIFDAIIEINREEGISILLVEQNVYLALEVSSRGYVLENGSIVLKDTSKNLLNDEMVKRAYLGIE
jgi:branched-chain amino acid transport system ATP-binding protein